MLTAQAFVRCQENDPVQAFQFPCFLGVVPVLENVRVQEQGLAAARGLPEGDFPQVVRRPRLELILWVLLRVPRLEEGVHVGQQSGGIAEPAVEIDLREEERDVLEILPPDGLAATLPVVVQCLRVADDVLVISQQRRVRQVRALHGDVYQMSVKCCHPVHTSALRVGVLHARTFFATQVREALRAEQAQQPLLEHELLRQRQRRGGGLSSAATGSHQRFPPLISASSRFSSAVSSSSVGR